MKTTAIERCIRYKIAQDVDDEETPAEARAELEAIKEWYEAVAEECALDFIHMTTPSETVKRLIAWNVKMALDPEVSEEANKLIERYKVLLKAATEALEAEGGWDGLVDRIHDVLNNLDKAE